MASEKQFENKVKKFLKENNCWYVKYWGGSHFTRSGIPDLICCVNGHFVAIELKGTNGKPSELQKYNIKKINECNGIGIILYPEGFEQFKTIVKGVTRCNSHIQDLTALKAANLNTKCVILTELKP